MTIETNAPTEVEAATPRRLGRIALTIAICLVSITVVLSIVLGLLGTQFAVVHGLGFNVNLDVFSPDPAERLLAVLGLLQGVLGTAAGLGTIVLSIVAITLGRQRSSAAIAIAIAVVAAPLTAITYLATVAISLAI